MGSMNFALKTKTTPRGKTFRTIDFDKTDEIVQTAGEEVTTSAPGNIPLTGVLPGTKYISSSAAVGVPERIEEEDKRPGSNGKTVLEGAGALGAIDTLSGGNVRKGVKKGYDKAGEGLRTVGGKMTGKEKGVDVNGRTEWHHPYEWNRLEEMGLAEKTADGWRAREAFDDLRHHLSGGKNGLSPRTPRQNPTTAPATTATAMSPANTMKAENATDAMISPPSSDLPNNNTEFAKSKLRSMLESQKSGLDLSKPEDVLKFSEIGRIESKLDAGRDIGVSELRNVGIDRKTLQASGFMVDESGKFGKIDFDKSGELMEKVHQIASLPKTTVSGVDVSDLPSVQAAKRAAEEIKAHKVEAQLEWLDNRKKAVETMMPEGKREAMLARLDEAEKFVRNGGDLDSVDEMFRQKIGYNDKVSEHIGQRALNMQATEHGLPGFDVDPASMHEPHVKNKPKMPGGKFGLAMTALTSGLFANEIADSDGVADMADKAAEFFDPTISGYRTVKEQLSAAKKHMQQGEYFEAAGDVASIPFQFVKNLLNDGFSTGVSIAEWVDGANKSVMDDYRLSPVASAAISQPLPLADPAIQSNWAQSVVSQIHHQEAQTRAMENIAQVQQFTHPVAPAYGVTMQTSGGEISITRGTDGYVQIGGQETNIPVSQFTSYMQNPEQAQQFAQVMAQAPVTGDVGGMISGGLSMSTDTANKNSWGQQNRYDATSSALPSQDAYEIGKTILEGAGALGAIDTLSGGNVRKGVKKGYDKAGEGLRHAGHKAIGHQLGIAADGKKGWFKLDEWEAMEKAGLARKTEKGWEGLVNADELEEFVKSGHFSNPSPSVIPRQNPTTAATAMSPANTMKAENATDAMISPPSNDVSTPNSTTDSPSGKPFDGSRETLKERVVAKKSEIAAQIGDGTLSLEDGQKRMVELSNIESKLENGADISPRELEKVGIDTRNFALKTKTTPGGKTFRTIDFDKTDEIVQTAGEEARKAEAKREVEWAKQEKREITGEMPVICQDRL